MNDAVSPEGSVRASPLFINETNGGSATFHCTALGGPGNVFYWKKLSSDMVIANGTVLSLRSLTVSDSSDYQCLVVNEAGEDNFTITLNGKIITLSQMSTLVDSYIR